MKWQSEFLLGTDPTNATDADPTAEMNEEHNNVQSDQDHERYNNPQFAKQFVTVQHKAGEREC